LHGAYEVVAHDKFHEDIGDSKADVDKKDDNCDFKKKELLCNKPTGGDD
jgi:hypothetical protein